MNESEQSGTLNQGLRKMQLGNFYVALAVKDLEASRAFYEKLGFNVVGNTNPLKGYLLMRNGNAKIGLFQGMIEKNIMTFNPADVRRIQRKLKDEGIHFTIQADESSAGPTVAMLSDPDGNPIMLDQPGY